MKVNCPAYGSYANAQGKLIATFGSGTAAATHSLRFVPSLRSFAAPAFLQGFFFSFRIIQATVILTSTMPTLQGKAVFLMPIRQVDAPNQCSSANKAVYNT